MALTYKRSAKSNILFVATVLFCAVVIFLFPLVSNLFVNRGVTPKVIDGVLDFNGVKMDSGREYYMTGDWDVFENQFVISDKIKEPVITGTEKVPHSVIDYLSKGIHFTSGKYATYRIFITGVTAQKTVSFYIPNFAGAYKIFIDRTVVTTSGTISDTPSDTYSTLKRMCIPVSIGPGRHEIIIEASSAFNFGLNMPPAIRNYARSENSVFTSLGLRYAFIGIVLFCGIFLFILKLFSKTSAYSLWGVALCILLAYRMMISNNGYIVTQNIFMGLSYEYTSLFIFAATFIIKLVSLFFITRALPIRVSPSSVIGFAVLFSATILIALFYEDPIYNPYYATLLQIVTLTLDLFLIEKISVCVVNKVRNSLAYLIAYSLVTVGLSVDFLYSFGFIQAPISMFLPMVLLVFAIAIVIIHAKNNALLQQEALHAAKLESELADANMSIMLSQIQPHFLYNALNTIKYLVRRDTEMAEKAIVEFSLYLRGNMDSLTQKKPIPFRTELEHIKHYCEIEKMRFGKKLDVIYDIEADDFYVPTLSIQPLMENSIKHGVTKRPEGGSVTLHTFEDDSNYYVAIEDNGIGFDPSVQKKDNRSHVGFTNIKSRLETMLNADITVESKIDVGTKTLITLPKESNFGE